MRGQHEKAVVYFQRALKLNPQYTSAWTLMGHEYMELKNPSAAIESYRKAIGQSVLCLVGIHHEYILDLCFLLKGASLTQSRKHSHVRELFFIFMVYIATLPCSLIINKLSPFLFISQRWTLEIIEPGMALDRPMRYSRCHHIAYIITDKHRNLGET